MSSNEQQALGAGERPAYFRCTKTASRDFVVGTLYEVHSYEGDVAWLATESQTRCLPMPAEGHAFVPHDPWAKYRALAPTDQVEADGDKALMRDAAVGEGDIKAAADFMDEVRPYLSDCAMTNSIHLALRQAFARHRATTPTPEKGAAGEERAVMVCPQCEGEGSYADGLDEAACSTECTRCGSNGWIVDLAALAATNAGQVAAIAWIERAREMMVHQREKADDYLNQAIAALTNRVQS